MGLGFSSLIGDGYVGLIGLFWVSMGLGISGLIGNGGVGLIRFFWVSRSGFDWQWWCGFNQVFLWVSMGLGFSGYGGRVYCFGKWV